MLWADGKGEFFRVENKTSISRCICIVQRVHFQVRVGIFDCQQTLTKISFFVFCAEMLQQFLPTPKGY